MPAEQTQLDVPRLPVDLNDPRTRKLIQEFFETLSNKSYNDYEIVNVQFARIGAVEDRVTILEADLGDDTEPNYLERVTGINLKSTGNTNLYTVESGSHRFAVSKVILRAVSINTLTVNPVVSIGVSADGDLFPSTTLRGLGSNKIRTFSEEGSGPSIAGGSTIYLKVETAATATTCTVDAYLFGEYLETT